MPAPPSHLIDARIAELADWRGRTLALVRRLIHEADPEVVEEWKWRGVPVWSHTGILCIGETYKAVVKLTFMKGASLADPKRLFNSSLEGNARRAIDIREGEAVDEAALKALIRAAVALNTTAAAPCAADATDPKAPSSRSPRRVAPCCSTAPARRAGSAKRLPPRHRVGPKLRAVAAG